MVQRQICCRLGSLGTFQVSVQGKWEEHEEDNTASVSFDSFSAHPLELFGREVDGFPQVSRKLAVPIC